MTKRIRREVPPPLPDIGGEEWRASLRMPRSAADMFNDVDDAEGCGFRRKPATYSDAKPASVPI